MTTHDRRAPHRTDPGALAEADSIDADRPPLGRPYPGQPQEDHTMNPTNLPPAARDASTDALFRAVRTATGWLNTANGTSRAEQTMRVLKVAEETGEAAAAWIGATGQNPRKGVTHTTADVARELADVAFTALVAIASIGHDPHTVMSQVVTKILGRVRRPCDLCDATTTTDAHTAADGTLWLCADIRGCDNRRAARAARYANPVGVDTGRTDRTAGRHDTEGCDH